jgi:peroxiredoxin Q/BCP
VTELRRGDAAPAFALRDADGRVWRLSDLRGQRVILYFYPADDTPGCTTQACDFRDTQHVFQENGYIVLGVSPQGAESHRSFARKFHLNFPLLIDDDFSVAESYGVKREEPGAWRDVPLDLRRCTFVIDQDGRIVEALYDVASKGHVDSLRELLSVA